MNIDLTGINSYKELRDLYKKIDKNGDKKVSPEELSGDEVKTFDRDESGTAEMWEFMGAVNDQRRAEIFTQAEIGSNKLVYEYLKDPDIEKLAGICGTAVTFEILQDCVMAGFTKEDIVDLLKSMPQASGKGKSNVSKSPLYLGGLEISIDWKLETSTARDYKSLPGAIQVLREAGLSKEKIIDLLKSILLAVGERGGNHSSFAAVAFKALSGAIKSLKEIGFNKEEIFALLKAVVVAAGHGTYSAYEAIPDTIKSLKETGLNKEEIFDFLKAVARAVGSDTDDAYEVLPAMIKAGYSEKEIVDVLKSVASVAHAVTNTAFKILPAMIQAKYTEEEIVALIKSVAQVAGSDADSALEALPAMIEAGYKKENIIDLLRSVARAAGNDTAYANKDWIIQVFAIPETMRASYAYKALPSMIKAGLNKEEIVDLLKSIAQTAGRETAYAYSVLPNFAKYLKDTIGKKGLLLVIAYARGNHNIYKLMELLEVDLKNCASKADFAKEFASKLNTFYKDLGNEEELRKISQLSAVVINKIHDNDIEIISDTSHPEYDLVRKTICKDLSVQAKYYLLSLGGADLYTSTFLKIYDDLIMQGNFLEEINMVDPEGKYMTGFILTLASFNRLNEVFKRNPEYFFKKIMAILSDGQEILRNGSLLIKTLEDILVNEEFRNYKQQTEDRILELYKEYSGKNNIDGKGTLGYIIKLCRDKFSPANKERAEEICQGLPEILAPGIPEEWLKDGAITAKLYFYDDEIPSYELIQEMYVKRGFKKENVDGKTVILTKTLNGIKLKVIITLDNSDVAQSIKDPNIDIVGHRGHSFHLSDTFGSYGDCNGQKKLLYLGSCGSFRSIPDLIKYYFGNYFIADEDTGKGGDNNNVLYYLMESIAKGCTDWYKINEYVNAHIDLKGRGIVFPNDKSLLLFDFVKRLEPDKSQ